MADKTWKAEERAVAALFGTRRTPLSGGMSAHTTSDTLHEDLYIEAKQRAQIPFWSVWVETRARARAESKQPIVVMHKKGSPDRVAMVDVAWLAGLVEARGALEELLDTLRDYRDAAPAQWDALIRAHAPTEMTTAWDRAKKALER